MKAHKIETKFSENGTLTLQNLPFQAGEEVEIIILERRPQPSDNNVYSLRDKVIRYDAPSEPVALEDWEVLQ